VTDAPGGGWGVRFAETMAGTWQPKITATTSLTGGTSPGVAIATISAGGDAGQAFAVTDPLGLVTRTYSDAMGRTTQTVEDFTDGEITDETNKTTGYTYNSAGMTSLTAYETGGGGETTAYVYGVTTGDDSIIDDNDIVAATEWPDPTTGVASDAQEDMTTVDALGETTTSTDRNGTTHTLSYDVLGRVVSDAVTTLGDGLDDSVLRIDTAYDGQGNAYLITSYDATSGGDVVNQVEDIYNGIGQLITEYQAVDGGVNTETTPSLQYAYDEMPDGADESRLASITYPSGYVLTYNYSSGINNDISRLSSLSDTTGTLESYNYLGVDTVVERDHPEATLTQTYISQTGSTGDAGDQYTGLDRFGRVKDGYWFTVESGVPSIAVTISELQYTYDRDGNVLIENNLVDSDFDQTFSYDGLNQLTGFTQGSSHSQDFNYDALGNFDSVTTDGGSPVTRTANDQNEITSVSGATTPTYDAAGNMTGDQNGKTFVYDAWNRLVAVKSGSTTLETFSYDGRNSRVTNTVDDVTTDLYYSTQQQVLEEQVAGADVNRYVWSPVYVNAMVLRDRATTTPGTLDERLWEQQDANWDVTSLVNNSGVAVERDTYDPYGVVTVYDGSYAVRSGGTSYASVYLYQGMRDDPISGLYAADERWYSPTLQVWISLDTSEFSSGEMDLYSFVGENPISFVDPFGLQKVNEPKTHKWDTLGGDQIMKWNKYKHGRANGTIPPPISSQQNGLLSNLSNFALRQMASKELDSFKNTFRELLATAQSVDLYALIVAAIAQRALKGDFSSPCVSIKILRADIRVESIDAPLGFRPLIPFLKPLFNGFLTELGNDIAKNPISVQSPTKADLGKTHKQCCDMKCREEDTDVSRVPTPIGGNGQLTVNLSIRFVYYKCVGTLR